MQVAFKAFGAGQAPVAVNPDQAIVIVPRITYDYEISDVHNVAPFSGLTF